MVHTFSLYAPTAPAVAVCCSAWMEAPRSMTRGEDGTWTLEAELPNGQHTYTFRMQSRSWFEPGKEVDIPDPLSRHVTDDQRQTILSLPPSGFAESYEWKHDAVPHPGHEHLAIYELYVQDFSGANGSATFAEVTKRLDYIADLGCTVVELMPIMQAGGWGYTPTFFHAVEPRFGNEKDICRLVDESHARGMMVFFDGVYNHASTDCPLAHIDHDCYFHHAPTDPNQSWGPQFNYTLNIPGTTEFPARHFIKNKVAHWIHVFHFDGIRYDAVSQIDDRPFLSELVDWTRSIAGVKPFFSIAECLPIDKAMVGPSGQMDACWNDPFARRMRSLLSGTWDGDALRRCCDCRLDGFLSGRDVVNYLGSHDLGHTLRHLLDAGLDEAAGLYRLQLGFIILLTSPGLPMIWMGDEFGAMDPATTDPHPLPWALMDDPRRREVHGVVKTLLHLRKESAALRGDEVAEVWAHDEQRVLILQRWDLAGGRFVIALHIGNGDQAVTFPAPAAGTWRNCLSAGEYFTDEAGNLQVKLGGWQALVLQHMPG